MIRRRLALLAAAGAVLAALLPGGARADTGLSVTLTAPTPIASCTCLRNTVTLTATPTAPAGASVASVDFQFAPAGSSNWTDIDTSNTSPYNVDWDTTTVTPGVYDLRAVVNDSAGDSADSATVTDQVVANEAVVIALTDGGVRYANGSVTFTAIPKSGTGQPPATATFEYSAAGQNQWQPISPATTDVQRNDNLLVGGNPTRGFRVTVNFAALVKTGKLTDGTYDIEVVGDAASGPSVSAPIRGLNVHTTPPTSAVLSTPSTLSGIASLEASASDGDGPGISAVRFEAAPAGTSDWSSVGSVTTPTGNGYTISFDTARFADGPYQVRVLATDLAGNSALSAAVSGFTIGNGAVTEYGAFTVTDYVPPADDMSILGTIKDSPQDETWAYGYTSAPPAEVDGSRLPYTAPPGVEQLVLLRYLRSTGWEIVDVLRNADGSTAFQQAATPTVTGAMEPSGEAWIVLDQQPPGDSAHQIAAFHRMPGGSFVEDSTSSAALTSLLGASGLGGNRLQLRTAADGSVFGWLLNPEQPADTETETGSTGSQVTVNTHLDYGLLSNGHWSLATAPSPGDLTVVPGASASLQGLALTDPSDGWAVFANAETTAAQPLMLEHLSGGSWSPVTNTGLDAFDASGGFSSTPTQVSIPATGQALLLAGTSLWIEASNSASSDPGANAIGIYDTKTGKVTASWCASKVWLISISCGDQLQGNVPNKLPDAIFDTPDAGPVAYAVENGSVSLYSHDAWTSVAAPGFGTGLEGSNYFSAPDQGWLVGQAAVGRLAPPGQASPLTTWPEPNRSTLLSVALPPGSSGGTDESGALAVGLGGAALNYDSSAGWQVTPTPYQARHIALTSVAFAGPSSAFAIGQFGTILHWDGTAWSVDPASSQLTDVALNSVAFAPDGQGWAVGDQGTILHYDGSSWTAELPPADDAGGDITSVAVAGSAVYAIAAGNLIVRGSDGTWMDAPPGLLPTDPAPAPGSLSLVSGLPDGGAAIAGPSLVMVQQASGQPFDYSAQPLSGEVVALAVYRDSQGAVNAYASVAPSIDVGSGAFPSGDGDLLRGTADGWQDLSQAQYPEAGEGAPGEGALKSDPVLGVATDPTGEHAWAVGGYAGSATAAGLGTQTVLASRPVQWQSASIWRYDDGGSAAPAGVAPASIDLPAAPSTVSFAFFSSAMCASDCTAVPDAQPDVNLRSASAEINQFAAQPGGPLFALFGGNARGPIDAGQYSNGVGALDMPSLPGLFAPLGGVPLYAAYGPADAVPNLADPTAPWAEAFANAPAPFGSSPAPPGITPAGTPGDPSGAVHKYYAFDAAQNGGTLRVIVLDNGGNPLQGGPLRDYRMQYEWLREELQSAEAEGVPVVVFASRPLHRDVYGGATDGSAVAQLLATHGVLAVFTTPGDNFIQQTNRKVMIPVDAAPGAPQIPEYEGATMGYQETQNNGVDWYDVSVNTVARSVKVQAIPIVSQLALEPLSGLTVARSGTLQFSAIARRPSATIATTIANPGFPGFDQYTEIPATSSCSGCLAPSYSFSSSDPTIGDFVVPSGPGSPYPALDDSGNPTHSSTSGLFCGFNTGTTTVSVTAGLATEALQVTVLPGEIGRPCGTVYRAGVDAIIYEASTTTNQEGAGAPLASPPPAAAAVISAVLPSIVPPPPPPAPAPAPAPPPAPAPFIPPPVPFLPPAVVLPPVVVPPIIPPVTPVPPGGSATAQAAARRKEKVHKHATESAYTIRPAGVPGDEWFYGATAGVSLLALVLLGISVPPRRRPRPVPVHLGVHHDRRRR
jgi:hypothetical protein